MKLEPRVRAKASIYEMDRDSGYLLMFKNKENAHLYGKKPALSLAEKKKAAAAAKKKKKAEERAAAAAAKKAAKASAKKVKTPKVHNGVKKIAAGSSSSSTSATKKTKAASVSSAFAALTSANPPPLTKQQSATAAQLARQGSQTHRWEFVDDKGGWSKYTPEASKLVEMEYQAWQQQPSVFVRSVRSGDWHYSVNFNTMEQTNINHPNHRVRKIRRAANF